MIALQFFAWLHDFSVALTPLDLQSGIVQNLGEDMLNRNSLRHRNCADAEL